MAVYRDIDLSIYQDIDYLSASAMIRAKETKMIGEQDLKKMLDAKGMDEAYKIVTDAGIGKQYPFTEYEAALNDNLKDAYRLIEEIAPEKELFHIFKYKYDGHNMKTIVKAQALGTDPESIMLDLGNVSPKDLIHEYKEQKFSYLNPHIAAASLEAAESLAQTHDPQVVDIILDRAVVKAMVETAKNFSHIPFIPQLLQGMIDIANIRGFVRIKRMGKEVDFLRLALFEGGGMDINRYVELFPKSFDEFFAVLHSVGYGKYLEPAFEQLRSSGSLTLFEKLCDNYIMSVIKDAKLIPFGPQTLVAYLLAKENETQAIRIVLSSKMAGVPNELITERLRDCYA